MAEATLLFVFCYDVSSHARRRRIARLLSRVAVRVQRSVFEAHVTERQAHRVAACASHQLGAGDSLRVYPLDAGARRRARVWGAGPRVELQRFFLL